MHAKVLGFEQPANWQLARTAIRIVLSELSAVDLMLRIWQSTKEGFPRITEKS